MAVLGDCIRGVAIACGGASGLLLSRQSRSVSTMPLLADAIVRRT